MGAFQLALSNMQKIVERFMYHHGTTVSQPLAIEIDQRNLQEF